MRTELIGKTVGNYTIVRKLGIGGMGEVFEAQQMAIGARVAIKVLNADATDPASAKRFLIEAQAVNRIQHDGVVKIIDAGYTDDDRPYLVMEYLDGASLAEVMSTSDRLPMGSACKVIADVLAVLAAAHIEGIVHRDLKPHNIFLTRSGRTVVLDFGVAKLLDTGGSVSLTLTGAIVGTPAYMAPEQIQGESLDGRADLYAVGVVLYELVTGRRPFDADQTFDLLTAHVERRPPPPRAIRPDVPVEVQAVLMSALAKERDDRFASAEAMRSALLQAASVMPAAAFAHIVLPGTPARRTPTVPPTGSGPVAAASAELAAATVPMPVRGGGSGPVRGSVSPTSDPTVRGKTGPAALLASASERGGAVLGGSTAATRAGGAATRATDRAEAAEDPMTDARPETSGGRSGAGPRKGDPRRAGPASAGTPTPVDHSGSGLPPPPGASTSVPTSRRPMVLALLALGAAAVFAAFVIGRFVGSRDHRSSSAPLVATGSDAPFDASFEPITVDAAPAVPHTVPKAIEDRLFRRHLQVADLPPEMVELLAAADQGGGRISAAIQAQLPALLDAIDALNLAADRIEAKLHRVEELLAASKLPGRTTDGVGDLVTGAKQKLGDGDTVGANDQLWRAQWILEHDGKAPPR